MYRSLVAMGWVLAIGQALGCANSTSPPADAAAGGAAGTHANSTVDGGAAGAQALPTRDGGGAQPTDSGSGDAAAAHPAVDPNVTLAHSAVTPDTMPAVSDADYATFVSNINRFGLDLGQAVAKSDGYTQQNLVYSPLSATLALAMTYGGARTQTAAEMKLVLGDTFSAGTFHAACNRLTRELASRATTRQASDGNVHKVELNLADSVFVERTLTLQPTFLDLLGREYQSGVRQVDFKNAFEPARISINNWVSDQTKAKITNLIPAGALDDTTRLVLVNALYFYGSWATPFEASATVPATFHPLSGADVQVATMAREIQLSYRAGNNFAVAELPYEGGQLRMTIVLPAAGQFEAVRSAVSATWLQQAVAGLVSTDLAVQLPKFKMTVGSFTLSPALKALGMKLPFAAQQADFSGITMQEPLFISDVLQKAFIAVDEDGTEAAAATAVIISTTSAQITTPVPFVVDRPFLFFIRDSSGAVLFSGQVVDPSH
jgi:serpin B